MNEWAVLMAIQIGSCEDQESVLECTLHSGRHSVVLVM